LISQRNQAILLVKAFEASGSTHVITSIVILTVSLGLFLYWFRYTCLLILSAKTSRDYAREVAMANGLRFVDIQSQISPASNREQLDGLRASLERDYDVVAGLLRHATNLKTAFALEDVMLKLDYRIMSTWYGMARSFSPRQAAQAVSEMCQIVNYFANTMGERAMCAAEL